MDRNRWQRRLEPSFETEVRSSPCRARTAVFQYAALGELRDLRCADSAVASPRLAQDTCLPSDYVHCGTLGIGLLPAHRGRGIGRALIRRTMDAALAVGLTRIELTVRE
ncbi:MULTISPECIES: GNAT family N-acetyltransferase [unclassified Bradyrhizobium]|uniref:GNAT family N-acetyltransferase n=1 Tax=unclassified Bradyrhizobium TaxID=2631580 RepID=UPI0028ECF6DA|nr:MULTISPECIES: GNAT family N-acetyltransferase [unclassified Bradyrhizobium]